jgi:hypothetical protein
VKTSKCTFYNEKLENKILRYLMIIVLEGELYFLLFILFFRERTEAPNIFVNSVDSLNSNPKLSSLQSNPSRKRQSQYVVSVEDLSAIS